MSFFSRFFGGRQSAIERELRDLYVQMLSTFMGFSPTEAEQMVSDVISMCKQQGIAEGTADLPEDCGARMIEAERMGDPTSKRIVGKARQEGATDDDIKEWWNLPDLSRRMVLWSENVFRYSAIKQAMNDNGLSAEDAAARALKMFPIYGDPEDTSKLSGDNRPLPHELRGRVDLYRKALGAKYITDQVSNFSSYNAYVRYAIQNGMI